MPCRCFASRGSRGLVSEAEAGCIVKYALTIKGPIELASPPGYLGRFWAAEQRSTLPSAHRPGVAPRLRVALSGWHGRRNGQQSAPPAVASGAFVVTAGVTGPDCRALAPCRCTPAARRSRRAHPAAGPAQRLRRAGAGSTG